MNSLLTQSIVHISSMICKLLYGYICLSQIPHLCQNQREVHLLHNYTCNLSWSHTLNIMLDAGHMEKCNNCINCCQLSFKYVAINNTHDNVNIDCKLIELAMIDCNDQNIQCLETNSYRSHYWRRPPKRYSYQRRYNKPRNARDVVTVTVPPEIGRKEHYRRL